MCDQKFDKKGYLQRITLNLTLSFKLKTRVKDWNPAMDFGRAVPVKEDKLWTEIWKKVQ